MRKHDLTREILDKNKIRVEIGEDGQPIVFQEYIQSTKYNRKHLWKEERKPYIQSTNPKYGKGYAGVTVYVKMNGEACQYVLSNIVWVYFNGQIPEGYDVDHINDNPLDNRLENLQLLTRKENLCKRGHCINQYTVGLSKKEREELWEKSGHNPKNKQRILEKKQLSQQINYERRQEQLERDKIRHQIDVYRDALRDRLKQNKIERDYYEILKSQATTYKTKKWINKRINGLIQEKKHLNRLISAPKRDWDSCRKMLDEYGLSQ